MNKVEEIEKLIAGNTEVDAIRILGRQFPGKVTFSSSLGYEDQVLTHMIFANDLAVKVFTLDTGRLFKETLETLNATRSFYNKRIDVYSPKKDHVDNLVEKKGLFSFYDSIENRKECCFIRKVEPLKRALAGNQVWITGIRAEQSDGRKAMPQVEWDEENQVVKYHPLLDWSFEEVKNFVNLHKIPYSPLHDGGYVSIGCEPCTRAIKPGEDFRAGRWWWEQSSGKECGLHIHNK